MSAPRYKVGAVVTVRRGTRDPDFPDIPLGGWSGVVREVRTQPDAHYLVAWNEYTLANLHPVYRQRCEADDLELETMWLREGDLEPLTGMQPALEQPGDLVPRRLRLDNPADRIRAALGLTGDDPLPGVDVSTLRRYQSYLNERLSFPFQAEFNDDEPGFAAPLLPVQVLRLWPAEELDPALGIQAEVREGTQVFLVPLCTLVVRNDGRAMVLLQDYTSWYLDWADQQDELDPELYPHRSPESVVGFAGRLTLYGAGCGASVGAVLTTIDAARLGFLVGAVLVGALGYLAGAKLGGTIDLTTGTVQRSVGGILLATFGGVFLGGVLGVLIIAWIGTLLGCMAANLLGSLLEQLRIRLLNPMGWAILGAFLGALLYALYLDREAATNGALLGASVGGGGMLVLLLLARMALSFMGRDEDDGPLE